MISWVATSLNKQVTNKQTNMPILKQTRISKQNKKKETHWPYTDLNSTKLNQTGHNGLEHQAVSLSDRPVPTKPCNTNFFQQDPAPGSFSQLP